MSVQGRSLLSQWMEEAISKTTIPEEELRGFLTDRMPQYIRALNAECDAVARVYPEARRIRDMIHMTGMVATVFSAKMLEITSYRPVLVNAVHGWHSLYGLSIPMPEDAEQAFDSAELVKRLSVGRASAGGCTLPAALLLILAMVLVVA